MCTAGAQDDAGWLYFLLSSVILLTSLGFAKLLESQWYYVTLDKRRHLCQLLIMQAAFGTADS